MVLSLITLAATVPLLATSTIQLQETSQRKSEDAEVELKTDKCHLRARPTKRMSRRRHEQLRDMQLVLDRGFITLEPARTTSRHPLTGYLLPYADRGYDGLVSTINADNMLNWIYIDRQSLRVRNGVRAEAESELTGPMSLLKGDGEWRIAYDEWEGFAAVRQDGRWALYCDVHDNGLSGLGPSREVVEVELVRTSLEEVPPSQGPPIDPGDAPNTDEGQGEGTSSTTKGFQQDAASGHGYLSGPD